MERTILALGLACVAASAAAQPLDARLTYSTDGGKTWSSEHPTVRAGATLKIRAAYSIIDAWEDRDVICAELQCAGKFASAVRRLPSGAYMQRNPTYWKTSFTNGAYDWTFDTTGLEPGSHLVRLNIGYWQKRGKTPVRRVSDDQPIYLTVEEGAAAKCAESKEREAK